MILNSDKSFDKTNQTLYKLVFPELPKFLNKDSESIRNFLLNVTSVNLPGLSLPSQEFNWQGGKIHIPDARISFNDLSVSYLVDEELKNFKIFWKWMTFSNNNKDKYVEDWNNIVCDAYLIYYNNWLNKEILRMNFINLSPNSLSDLSLTTKTDGSETMECQVTFSIDRCELVD